MAGDLSQMRVLYRMLADRSALALILEDDAALVPGKNSLALHGLTRLSPLRTCSARMTGAQIVCAVL